MDNRKRKLYLNTVFSLVYQATTIICGFILPRLILTSYGSEVNGLVNSIKQFLSIISFLELGVGAVVQSALYSPLAKNDSSEVSKIIKSATKFFKTIARILLAYVIFLVIFYPRFANQNFGYTYTATLIIAISISSFAQYYFGIVNRLLVTADQRGYVQYITQTIAIIANTIACYFCIKAGFEIQIVKLVTSIIYIIQPILVDLYVRKHYQIDRKIQYTEEPIKQKWNGIAQHVAAVILDNTDTIVLTLFSTLSSVSIYSVYYLVVKGVKQLLMSMTNGVQALMGELWAIRDKKELEKLFSWTEWLIHSGVILIFGTTAIAIVPFIQVYTKGVNDANYYQPLFAFLLVAANAGHCLRLPYNMMILAGGHYKQTQNNYIIAAVLNVLISIIFVKKYGLIGVAIGTLVAMIYQTFWMAWYDSKNFIQWPFKKFIKQIITDCIIFALMWTFTKPIKMNSITYGSWIFFAIKIFIISMVVCFAINYLLYRDKTILFINKIINKITKKRKK